MRIDIMTLFPETVGDMMNESILGRAQERGYIRIDAHQIRDYTVNKQKQVDDYPYGGASARTAPGPSISPPAARPSVRPRPGSCWRTTAT